MRAIGVWGGEYFQYHLPNNTNNDHWWGFDDGDRFDDFLLVGLGASLVHFPDDVGHTSLVALEGSQVHWGGLQRKSGGRRRGGRGR